MAALSGPASTMTVLRGETAADLITERFFPAPEAHGTEYVFETHERMIGHHGTAFKKVVAVLALDDHRVAAIRRLACLAEITLEFSEADLHSNQIIRLKPRWSISEAARILWTRQ